MNKQPSILLSVPDKGIKEQTSDALNTTFFITQVFLIAAALITFVGAFQSSDKKMRLALGLESLISAVAAYYYSIFVNKISGTKAKWADVAQIRYQDWAITTPIMLFVLALILGFDAQKTKHIVSVASIIILDYIMLYFGYLGEMGKMDKWSSCLWGFIPFMIMFYLLYYVFLMPNYSNKKAFLYWSFFTLWALYGRVSIMDGNTKNIIFNMLDAITKGGVGVGLYTHFI